MKTEEIVDAARNAGFSSSEIMHRLAAFKQLINSAAYAEREKFTNTQEFVTLPREVVEQALEALLNEGNFRKLRKPLIEESIKQIKAALEQPGHSEQSYMGCVTSDMHELAEWLNTMYEDSKEQIAALEQPQVEQEPVAWMFHAGDIWKFRWHHFNRPVGDEALKHWQPIYTHPQPKREPLTDEQIASACFYYRNDLGLLSQQQKNQIKFQAIEWNAALEKARAHNIK